MYHNQSDSFLTASGNPEKGRAVGSFEHPTCRVNAGGGGGGEEGNEDHKGLRMHLPFLKSLAVTEGPPQPNDPNNLTSSQLFVVEPLSRKVVEPVGWVTPCRLRHVCSGKYLAVNTDAPMPTNAMTATTTPQQGIGVGGTAAGKGGGAGAGAGGGALGKGGRANASEVWFAPYLADDCFPTNHDFTDFKDEQLLRDGDQDGNLDLAFPSFMVFHLTPTEEPPFPWLPLQDVPLRIEHRYRDTSSASAAAAAASGAKGTTTMRTLYLHDTELYKPWSSTRAKAGQQAVEASGLMEAS
jgi:hypothetical protein